MPLPSELNQDKLAKAALAMLGLTAFRDHAAIRAWKGLDWDLLDLLHQKGWIGPPQQKRDPLDVTARGSQDPGRSSGRGTR